VVVVQQMKALIVVTKCDPMNIKILILLSLMSFCWMTVNGQDKPPLIDDIFNTVQIITYDGTTSEIPVDEKKIYFDPSGVRIQMQYKNYTSNKIMGVQDLIDTQKRLIGSSLSAPITASTFSFVQNFLTSANDIPGTLKWYYSTNNTLEPLTPKTQYPYTNSSFYNDGTGGIKLSADAGDQHRLGTNHEILSGSFPVFKELNDYRSKRATVIPGIGGDGSLVNGGVQSVVRDQNGNYQISITDKEGKVIMTARKGDPTNYALAISNTIIANAVSGSVNYRPLVYFYVLNPQVVNISGSGSYTVENLISGQSFTPSGTWAIGFYRILVNSGEITVSYQNHFLDVAYSFYDNSGRLKASVSPNGYEQWTGTRPANYSDIDKTTYDYNFRGHLQSMTETDSKSTKYLYRKDGSIRFSQNAEQAKTALDDFSYTHYDLLGRPIESGEYTGTSYLFSSLSSQLEYNQQIAFPLNETKDWIKTYYDYPVATIPNLPVSFTQAFVRNAVSCTENSYSKTWYSYDEMGRVVWRAQKPSALNRTFLTQYSYDFLGNVLTVKNSSYSGETELQPFYHHYGYDPDKRLSKVYTSLDGSTKKLRATYTYYLHGPRLQHSRMAYAN
jgi:hypothetical protein